MNFEEPGESSFINGNRPKFKYTSSRKKLYFVAAGVVLGIFVIIFLIWMKSDSLQQSFFRDSPLSVYKKGGAVCSDGVTCSTIGRDILKRSGSAVDAAIASLFCNGIYTMQSMSLGGGFQMVIYKKDTGEAISVDAREVAPAKSSPDMFQNNTRLSKIGGLACGVPGELKGYLEAHNRFGSNLTWKDLVEPSYDMCVNGYHLSLHQHDSIIDGIDSINSDETLKSIFLEEGTNEPKPVGTLIKPPKELCDTLKIIMEEGPDSFYNGKLAQMFAQDVQDLGGIITTEDLQNYRVKVRSPASVTLQNGYSVHSSPIPGSGVLLGFILKVLDGYNITSDDVSNIEKSTILTQRIVETFKHAFAFRTQLGENANNISKIIKKLSSDDFARDIRTRIRDNETMENIENYGDGAIFYSPDSHGTSHVSVIAPNGDAVSVTSTNNIYFGAGLGKRTGIILNNGMDDFSSPGFVNFFGLRPSPSNFITPGHSAMSSMTPTIVVDDKKFARLVVGSSGGPKITTSTAWVIIQSLWLKRNMKEAIDSKRFHHQLTPNVLQYESGFSEDIIDKLKEFGHKVESYSNRGSIVCGIEASPTEIMGNADFRKDGIVCGFDITKSDGDNRC